MLGSYQYLLLMKLILFQALELMSIEDDSFRRYRRVRTSNDSNTLPGMPLITVVTVSMDDNFVVVNCTTNNAVPQHKLDWYFQKSASRRSPRVIWQRGRSNVHRYMAYSPDQLRHFLQIKPIYRNDSGTYICIDQTTGFQAQVELLVRDSRSCGGSRIRLEMTGLLCLVVFSLILSRRLASESEVT